MMHRPTLRSATAPAAIILLAVSGCTVTSTPDERSYAIPEQPCGMNGQGPIENLFPPGSDLDLHVSTREVGSGKTSAQGACIATVDGENAFSILSSAAKYSFDVETFIEESNFRGDLTGAQLTTSGKYQLTTSVDHSIAFIRCVDSRIGNTGMGFILSVYRGEDKDRDLSSIVTEYADIRMAELGEGICDMA